MPSFSIGSDPRSNWEKWKRAFERFIAANNIIADEEKYNLLLVLGGIELQSHFDKLDQVQVCVPIQNSNELLVLKYESAIQAFDNHFAPQLNKRFERHQFRALKQEHSECFEDFIFRLREQGNRCQFVDSDDMIIDQIIEGCYSTDLRKKLLTEEKTLLEILQLGKTMEEVQKHAKEYDKTPPLIPVQALVQKGTNRPFFQRPGDRIGASFSNTRKCYNCNRPGHIAKDVQRCPARSVTCFNCGAQGHFKACCRKRKHEETQTSQKPNKRVCAVVEAPSEPGISGIFFVDDGQQSEILLFDVGGVQMNMVVDSGSPANILRESTYQKLKETGANIINERSANDLHLRLESFASDSKIVFSRAFEAEIKVPDADAGVWTHFLVAPKGQTDLLSKTTAFALGVLKIGYSVNQICNATDSSTMNPEFPKLPGVSLKIQVDEQIKPIVQAARRLPISMEADVEKVGYIFFYFFVLFLK